MAQAWTAADSLLAGRLLYPEARAGLAAALRGGRLTPRLYSGRKAALTDLWREVEVVEITPGLAETAGELAERHALRGYDAVHLASAVHGRVDALVTADADLLRAAGEYGVGVIDARS
ncbi:MAG: type II toxin-antitoxin system VapC family toxin [Candidatus Dormibacteraeota bacterium]|nr:type II toxin-antitoxin system VapC family toxin [Candidatus Dormibacteraeota bacterium]